MLIIPHKVCTKCGQSKPITEFARSQIARDGFYPSCKACKAAARIVYKASNREHVLELSRQLYERHAESLREKNRQYYAENKDKVSARTMRYQRNHPEQTRKYQHAYKQRHRDRLLPEVRARSAEWREQNRDKDQAASKRWQRSNPEAYRAIQHRRRARVRGSSGSYTAQEWQELKARYHHRCLRCGRSEPEIVLTVDHVVPISLGGSNDIANIQPLCRSCNSSKQATSIDYR